jgi:hypothetical protein
MQTNEAVYILCIFNRGDFFGLFFLCMYFSQHCFICRPSDTTVSEDPGIEPRTVAASALAVRRSIATRLHLIPILIPGVEKLKNLLRRAL